MTANRTAAVSAILMATALGLLLVPSGHSLAAGSESRGMTALESAAASGKYLFIFFWRNNDPQNQALYHTFQSAMEKMSDTADAVSILIIDAREKPVVDKFGVSRAPMPLVLAIAPNGAITKGCPSRFDESQLRQALVSPCTADCMKALQDRKLVLLCVQNQSQVKQVSLQKGVEDFTTDKEYAHNSKVVVLNAGDPTEGALLKSLQVDPNTAAPVTVFMAPPASVIGTFTGAVTKEQLVAKLKSAQSSCCPGGKCGPGGCGPK